jgi:periplasmic divalent cation tolerance protein
MDISIIYMTARDEREAEKIVTTLLDEKLIACGNIFPVRSIYSWRGEREDEGEAAVIMKTRSLKVVSVVKRIKELHSYEVPEIISFKVDKGNKDYLTWVSEESR